MLLLVVRGDNSTNSQRRGAQWNEGTSSRREKEKRERRPEGEKEKICRRVYSLRVAWSRGRTRCRLVLRCSLVSTESWTWFHSWRRSGRIVCPPVNSSVETNRFHASTIRQNNSTNSQRRRLNEMKRREGRRRKKENRRSEGEKEKGATIWMAYGRGEHLVTKALFKIKFSFRY